MKNEVYYIAWVNPQYATKRIYYVDAVCGSQHKDKAHHFKTKESAVEAVSLYGAQHWGVDRICVKTLTTTVAGS